MIYQWAKLSPARDRHHPSSTRHLANRTLEDVMAAAETSIGTRTNGAFLDSQANGGLIRVGPRAELRGVTVVSGGQHGIAVFPSSVSEAVYAIDNRCPHMGFPLHK